MSALDAANWEKYYPKDLIINPTSEILAANTATDKNNFTFVAPNLKTNSTYSFQFKYVFEDGEESTEWSPTYTVFTSNIATLPKPKLTSANVTYFQGILNVSWDGTDYNNTGYGNGFSRILIWIRDNSQASPLFRIAGELSKPGTFRLALPPKSHTVKLTAISVNGEESEYSDEFTFTPALTPPLAPTGVTPAWSGTDFTVTFTHTPSNSSNEYLKEYLVTLNTATSGTKTFSLLPVSGSTQKFSLSLEQNQAAFGTAETAFSGTIETLDIYGNRGIATSFSSTAYVSVLQAPTIIAAATTNGYTVSYTAQTSNTFKSISIEEVVSSATTDPGTGYSGVATGATNPIFVPTTNTNKRWVRAKLFDTVNSSTSYSTAVTVTPLSPVTVDNDGPPDVTTVTTTGGLDSSGTIGFNGYADISWNSVTTGGIRGYRIRFRPITTPASSYSYADSPGSATSYRLAGLGAGLTYEIAIATYDEYNNTSSSYVAGSNVSVGGTPYIASTVDVTGFFKAKANPSDADSTAFKFGYGVDTGKRGLVFNTNNYWYIDSSQTATLKVGGATTNYIEWNGSSFVIDGDMRAKKGSFSGNVSIASGASIYSGTLTGNTVTTTGDTGGSLSGAGYILNSSGLTFNSSSISGITTIDATTGLLTSQSANIGGWLISPSTNVGSLYKTTGTNTVKLDSAGYITVSGTGYETGIGYPSSSGADANIVIWAGATKAGAPFKVFKDGSVSLPAATFDGYATDGELSAGLATKIGASDVNSNVTSISGGVISTGAIQSNNYSPPTVSTTINGYAYSAQGTRFDITNGAITGKNFVIDSSGNAAFKGVLSAGIAIDSPIITGGSLNIGNGQFTVSSLGALTAQSANITGTITIDSNNAWSPSGFRMGSSGSYITYSGSAVTLKSGTTSNLDDSAGNPDGGGTTPNSRDVNSEIILNSGSTGLSIKGIPSLGNYTKYAGGGLYTNVEANDNNYLYGMGRAARLRTIVQDYYDDRLYRGFAVYYGVRSSAPSGSTGLVGDLWVSW